MAKKNPLQTDFLGPMAEVEIEGRTWRVLRPTALGWELELKGSSKKRLITRHELESGENDRSIIVHRLKGEHPSLQALDLKARRDIFIKHWWLTKVFNALKNGSLGSTGDVDLRNFFDTHMDAAKEALAAWEKKAGYDHAAARRKKTRKPNIGSTAKVVEPAPHPRTVRRLLPKWLRADRNPLCLRKRTELCRKGGKRLHPLVETIAVEGAKTYAGEANPNVEGIRKTVAAKVMLKDVQDFGGKATLKPPVWSTIARRIDDLPEAQKIGGRKGVKAILKEFGPFGEGPRFTRTGERTEMDCWNIPLFVLLKRANVLDEIPHDVTDLLVEHAERIHVSGAADKASGYITGLRFGLSESSELTAATLKMAMTDKTAYSNWAGCESAWCFYSGGESLLTDAGPGYVGNVFLSAAIPSFSDHAYAASGLPHLRGLIESIWSTMHKGFIAKNIARAFENVVARGEYKPEKRAIHRLEAFLRLLIRYVVDIYHHLPRDGGLRGSPHSEFETLSSAMEPKAPPTADEIRVRFGTEVSRKLGPHGVRVMHIEYDSDWLLHYRAHIGNQDVVVRIDEDDISFASVLIPGLDDFLTVPAKDPEFGNVRMDEWKDLLEDLRLRFGEEGQIDFARYVAPALLAIDATNRAAEEASKLEDVFWDDERFRRFEGRYRMHIVNRRGPDPTQTPSLETSSLGRRFDRPADPRLPPPPPDVVPGGMPPSEPPTPDAPKRRRIQYRDE